MTDIKMPPLPEPEDVAPYCGQRIYAFTAKQMYDYARAAVQANVPDGMVLVPIEPTREMWEAANKVDDAAFCGGSMHGADIESIWNAMLSAIQKG